MALYIKSQKGFGNKVFDLLSAVYLKRRYKVPVYLAMDDLKFSMIMDKSKKLVKYITIDEYYKIKPQTYFVQSFDTLPQEIDQSYTIIGMERCLPYFYDSISTKDIESLQINPNVVSKDVLAKSKQNNACIYVRYDSSLCEALREDDARKRNIMIYDPSYYKAQIQTLLDDKDIQAVYVIGESKKLLEKYVVDGITDPRVEIAEYPPLDLFYLMVTSNYLVLSHNIFSFAAAYLNKGAKISLLMPSDDGEDEESDWEIIKDSKYIMTNDSELMKEMAYEYGDCDRYLVKIDRFKKAKGSRSYPKAYYMIQQEDLLNQKGVYDSFSSNGPTFLRNVVVRDTLKVSGGLNFFNVLVRKSAIITGTLYGVKGTIYDLGVYGEAHLEQVVTGNCLVNGSLVAQNCILKGGSMLIGNNYLSHCSADTIQLITLTTVMQGCKIDELVILNNMAIRELKLINCSVRKLVSTGIPITVTVDPRTRIGSMYNASVVINTY